MKRSPAAQSLFIWAWGIAFASISCLLNPYAMLEVMNVADNGVTLARMIAVMLGALAIYYFVMASSEALRPMWLATVYIRLGVFPLSIVMLLADWIDVMAVPIFTVDTIGGLWTALALRRSG
ncbi:MAG: hypothetical protein HOC23_12445 [Halieaceae bacterium]|jgi:hypothetical protein|nr:hypothetical protein [Halieaceae bacterium]